jgi:hypothetical protein
MVRWVALGTGSSDVEVQSQVCYGTEEVSDWCMVLVSGALAGIFCRVEVYSEENHLDEENLYAQKHICSVIVTTRKQSLFVLSLSLIIRKHSRKKSWKSAIDTTLPETYELSIKLSVLRLETIFLW